MAESTVKVGPPDPADTLQLIRDQELAIQAAENYVARKAQELKDAKGALAAAIRKMRSIVSDEEPLYSVPTPPKPVEEVTPADDMWRAVDIADLDGLTAKDREFLAAKEIVTIGALADYTKDRQLTDIEGIGEARANRIADALEKFWADRKAPEAPLAKADDNAEEPAETAAA